MQFDLVRRSIAATGAEGIYGSLPCGTKPSRVRATFFCSLLTKNRRTAMRPSALPISARWTTEILQSSRMNLLTLRPTRGSRRRHTRSDGIFAEIALGHPERLDRYGENPSAGRAAAGGVAFGRNHWLQFSQPGEPAVRRSARRGAVERTVPQIRWRTPECCSEWPSMLSDWRCGVRRSHWLRMSPHTRRLAEIMRGTNL